MEAAIVYYKRAKKGRRSLSGMNKYYRWIKTEQHMRRLREMMGKNEIVECRASRLAGLRQLLKEEIEKWLQKGYSYSIKSPPLPSIEQSVNSLNDHRRMLHRKKISQIRGSPQQGADED